MRLRGRLRCNGRFSVGREAAGWDGSLRGIGQGRFNCSVRVEWAEGRIET
jgi:hypothetical protein